MINLPPLRRQNLSSEIAGYLRDQIISGRLHPGERLNLDAIAEQLGVSRMPVRDAVLQLAHEGLTCVQPRRCVIVAPLPQDDVRDAYQVLAFVAGITAERAAVTLSELELGELAALHRQMEGVDSQDNKQLESANWQFHRIINQASKATKLLWLMRTLTQSVPRQFYRLIPDWHQIASAQHAAILAALEARDDALAHTRACQHVADGGRMLVEYLARADYWPDLGATQE